MHNPIFTIQPIKVKKYIIIFKVSSVPYNIFVNILQVELLRNCIGRTRVKTSVALDGLVSFGETYHEYDPLLTGAQPSNPWVTDDHAFWTFNSPL